MKKIIGLVVCLGILFASVSISYADSWNARKNKVKQMLKKNNLVTSDRFELVYAQKLTDRMANHFVYILQDTQTGMEYLVYTVGDGDSTQINNLAISPLLQNSLLGQPTPSVNKIIPKSAQADEPDTLDSEDKESAEPEDAAEPEDQEETDKKK
ncbi:MAG: hypothetical protein V1747_01290 [Candidatus Omnitrophota bacterium]